SADLNDRIPIGNGPGKGRHYHVADDSATLLIMQDSTRHWTLHAIVGEDQDMARQFERTVGVPVKYDMLYVGEWKQNLLLADHYGKGRVFLAGDSVHLVIPTGGLGMNTGIGDAIDLSWKLAGSLRGWGGPSRCSASMCRPPGRAPVCRMSGSTATSPCRTAWGPATRCFASVPPGRTRPRCSGPSRRTAPPSMFSTSPTTRLAMFTATISFCCGRTCTS